MPQSTRSKHSSIQTDKDHEEVCQPRMWKSDARRPHPQVQPLRNALLLGLSSKSELLQVWTRVGVFRRRFHPGWANLPVTGARRDGVWLRAISRRFFRLVGDTSGASGKWMISRSWVESEISVAQNRNRERAAPFSGYASNPHLHCAGQLLARNPSGSIHHSHGRAEQIPRLGNAAGSPATDPPGDGRLATRGFQNHTVSQA